MPSPLRNYVKYSLGLHVVLFGVLVVASVWSPRREPERLQFVVMAKGTKPDAVLTQQVLNEMKLPEDDPRVTKPPPAANQRSTPEPARSPTPATPEQSPAPTATPTPAPSPRPATPRPTTPAPATPAPVEAKASPTPAPTGTPRPTPSPTPKPSPSPSPTATPKPSPSSTATPKPSPTAKPSTPTPKPAAKTPPVEKKSDQQTKATPAPKKSPSPTPKVIASAYDTEQRTPGRKPGTPSETPAGAKVSDQAPKGREAGVPGEADGVEGAPVSLAAEQSPLPPVYANRAIMLLTRHFRVPPEMNEPEMMCVVEWDILPDGRFANLKVVKSTGSEETDRLAIDAVLAVARLDPLPPQFRNRPLRVSYPFVYGY